MVVFVFDESGCILDFSDIGDLLQVLSLSLSVGR